jgi:nucleotide-binding universal stress UspA family protein
MADDKHLLIPVDGSDNSIRALAYVVSRAAKYGRLRICVINVQRAIAPSLFITRAMIAGHHESQSKEALIRARQLLAKRRVKAQILVRIGEPAETIVKTAKLKRCGGIVMGSRGLGSLKGLLLGSTTTKVIHRARIPILVVP